MSHNEFSYNSYDIVFDSLWVDYHHNKLWGLCLKGWDLTGTTSIHVGKISLVSRLPVSGELLDGCCAPASLRTRTTQYETG